MSVVILLSFLGNTLCSQGRTVLESKPYRFDVGAARSQLAEGALLLTPNDRYQKQKWYGWIIPPAVAFERSKRSRSRCAMTIDGSAGLTLSFQADVPKGLWWVTAWIEAGHEDSSTVTCALNGGKQPLDWQVFAPPAEGRTDVQPIYRVFNLPVEVGEKGIRLDLQGVDSVRVLGIALIPDAQPVTAEHHGLLRAMKEAGELHSTQQLSGIREDLERIVRRAPDDAFASFWWVQWSIFEKAERYFSMRGWEWANDTTGLGLFARLHQTVMLLDGLLNHPHRESLPFFERALFMRGRLLYWLDLERGGTHESASGQRDLTELLKRHPGDTLLRMYNGERILDEEPVAGFVPPPHTPSWAIAQWEVLTRLKSIAHWWVNVQQAPNGELGGKLGDDVEILRWWSTLVMAGDETTLRGWKRLADGVWESREIHDGYARLVSDVEHSSEFIADTAPMMVLSTDDRKYVDRLKHSARHFKDLWTGWTTGGRRHFRSAWFSSTEVDTIPPKNRDVHYNARATKAVRYLAWRTRDPEVIRSLHEWSSAWAHAAMRANKGKPRGIIPASIRFPDEAVNGDEPTWYGANMMWDYFDWGSGAAIYDQLLFTWTLTGDPSLLEPLESTLALIERYAPIVGVRHAGHFPKGSAEWTVARLLSNKNFWNVAGSWRLLKHDSRFDQLIVQHGAQYVKYRLTGEERYLLDAMDDILGQIRYNTPLLTSEVIHTDRVFVTVHGERSVDQLGAMIAGLDADESSSPYAAVTWLNTGEDLAVLVTDATNSKLALKLYSFAETAKSVEMRLWQLEPGEYFLESGIDGRVGKSTRLQVRERGQRVAIGIPPGQLTSVRVMLKESANK